MWSAVLGGWLGWRCEFSLEPRADDAKATNTAMLGQPHLVPASLALGARPLCQQTTSPADAAPPCYLSTPLQIASRCPTTHESLMEMSISGLGVNMKKQYGREIVAAVCQADAFLPRVQVGHQGTPGGSAREVLPVRSL